MLNEHITKSVLTKDLDESLDIGKANRELIFSEKTNRTTRLLLFFSARSECIRRIINPALRAKKTVICDRFYDSSIAYYSYGKTRELLAIGTVKKLSNLFFSLWLPNVTFFIDVAPSVARKRLEQRDYSNSLDRLALKDVKKIRGIFKYLAREDDNRIITIKTTSKDTPEQIHEKIKLALDNRIP